MTSKETIVIKGDETRLPKIKRKLKIHCAKEGITYLDFIEKNLTK